MKTVLYGAITTLPARVILVVLTGVTSRVKTAEITSKIPMKLFFI